MEERQITIAGETRKLQKPFFVIATQNPVETAGTFPLPEAQLDRFLMQLSMGTPDRDEEIAIMNRFISDNPLDTLSSVCTIDELLSLQQDAKNVFIHQHLIDYIADIVIATRKSR